MPILVQGIELGLNDLLAGNTLDPRGAAKGSENVLYGNGLISSANGFSKLGMTDTGLLDGTTAVPITSIFNFKEFDGYDHLVASTTRDIYELNFSSNEWKSLTTSATNLQSDIDSNISVVQIAHNSTETTLNDVVGSTQVGYHLIFCDGGKSDIIRWAGRYETDFANLLGGGGYHEGTTHRAKQIGQFQSRLILISPLTYDVDSKIWSENNQRVQFPVISKIETWTGTGSGFIDLIDTGGVNVWSAPLGNQYIVYQTRGIWALNPVGGTTVMSPSIQIPDIGLLAPKLLTTSMNVHFFVGTDYKVYAYYGGTTRQSIGDPIEKSLREDLSPDYQNRCMMVMGKNNEYVWIYIVPNGKANITRAYGYNIRSQAWSVLDFAEKFSSGGITAVVLSSPSVLTTGETYNQEMNNVSLYIANDGTSTSGDMTVRYADYLYDTSRALDYPDVSKYGGSWCSGGLQLISACADCSYKGDFTVNDVLVVKDGSTYTDTTPLIPFGTHFYTITDVSSSYFKLAPSMDASTANCISHIKKPDITTQWEVWQPLGKTYKQCVQEIRNSSEVIIGDNSGFIYAFDATSERYDDIYINAKHLTPVVDLQQPDILKRWGELVVLAKGEGIKVEYRIDNFDTSETGWVYVS
jgi:hypothetical protein